MLLDEFMRQAVVVLGTAVVGSLICGRLRLPSLIGLLLTGLLIGPSGLALVDDIESVETFAEIGVVMLLFVIGLELNLEHVKDLRRAFAVGGSVQALLTIALFSGLGLLFGLEIKVALFLGFVATLSSTAVVLKLYGDRRETQTPQGHAVMGILLFQDFLVVPMIVLTPILAGAVQLSFWTLTLKLGGSILVILAVFLAARRLVPRLLDLIGRAKAREVFVLGALAICLAMSWMTHSLGFSLALGAFLAGLLVTETEYSHQMLADVAPFRDLFASIFFVSIGMLVDLEFARANLGAVLGLALLGILLKFLIAFWSVRAIGSPFRIALIAGLGLAQIGEFSFVLIELGREYGLLTENGFQLFLSASVLTLAAAPFLIRAAPALAQKLGKLDLAPPVGEKVALSGHVIIVGHGLNGRLLAKVLGEVRIPFAAIDLSSESLQHSRQLGRAIVLGDATRSEILEHAGAAQANMIVYAISDVAAVRQSVHAARRINPKLMILVRTRLVREIEGLRHAGADQVVAEEFEAAIEIFTRVLERFHVPRNVIRAQTRILRGEDYRILRAPALRHEVSARVLDALAAGSTDLYLVGSESLALGQTLRQLDLRQKSGVSVLAVVRGESSMPNPSPDLSLEAGDVLVLVGSHREVDEAFALLDREHPGPGDRPGKQES